MILLLTTILTFTLSWDANKEPDLLGYRVYIGPQENNWTELISVGKDTTYKFERELGTLTYLAVTAYDTANNESELSEIVNVDLRKPQKQNINLLIGKTKTFKIQVTADDGYELWFNNHSHFKADEWETFENYIIETESNNNELIFKCWNSSSIAGLLCKIKFNGDFIYSDTTWNVSIDKINWEPATQVARYGEGLWNDYGNVKEWPVTDEPLFWIWEDVISDTIYIRKALNIQLN